jgi:hypothetical protein
MYISLELLRKQRDYLLCEIPNPDTEEIQGIVNMFDAILDAGEVDKKELIQVDFRPDAKPLVFLFVCEDGEVVVNEAYNKLEAIEELSENSAYAHSFEIYTHSGTIIDLLYKCSQYHTYFILSEEDQELIKDYL